MECAILVTIGGYTKIAKRKNAVVFKSNEVFTMPIRIQRKRTRGWKLPPNTVCVTRGTKYGNPFKVGGYFKMGKGENGMAWLQCLIDENYGFTKILTNQMAVDWFEKYISLYPFKKDELNRLRGKNLACWCKIGSPCHADVLLEISNK